MASYSKNYPKSVGQYVISQNLWKSLYGSEFYKLMEDYLGLNLSENEDLLRKKLDNEKNFNSIENAMHFLESAIKNELQKEYNFIVWFNKLTNLNLPPIDGDWSSFIKSYQTYLTTGNNQLKALENEYSRLIKNESAQVKRYTNKEGKEYANAKRELLSTTEYVRERMQAVAKFLDGTETKIGKEIVEFIVANYNDKLITVNTSSSGITLQINQSQTRSIIMGLSQLLIERFYLDEINDYLKSGVASKFDKTIEKKFTEKMKNTLKNDEKFNLQIINFLDRLQNLPFLTGDLKNNYQIPETTETINVLNTKTRDLNKKEEQNLNENIIKNIRVKNMRPSINFLNDSNIAELSVPIHALFNNAIAGINSGKRQSKTDNITAHTTLTVDILNPPFKELEELHTTISSLESGLAQTNTQEYYNLRENEWDNATKKINDILASMKTKYDIIADCFLIEESTKAYVNMNTNTGKKGETSFHGGSLGGNIEEQINKIQALNNIITPSQANWLITAAINCGPNLILSNEKTSLENYLSIFATILLFDDQRGIAKEATDQMQNNMVNIKPSQVHKLHLFTLNQGVFPLSYVLKLTYDKLVRIYGLVNSDNLNMGGAQVNISGFINPDEKYPPKTHNYMTLQSWTELANQAKKQVTMKVSFITNFMNVLEQILYSNTLE